MWIFRQAFALVMLLACSAASIAQGPAPDSNLVEVTITRNGALIAAPKFVMQLGSTAVMTLAKEDGFSLKVKLDSDQRLVNGRSVGLALYLADEGRWKLAATPAVSMGLNTPSQLLTSDSKGAPLEFKVVVKDSFSGTFSARGWGKNKCSERKLANWREKMALPVRASMMKAGQTQPGFGTGCCRAAPNLTCCSSGPMCCSDGNGHSCCNG